MSEDFNMEEKCLLCWVLADLLQAAFKLYWLEG